MLKHAVARAQQENAARAEAAAEEIKRLRAQVSQQAAHIRTLRAGPASYDGSQVQTSSSGWLWLWHGCGLLVEMNIVQSGTKDKA